MATAARQAPARSDRETRIRHTTRYLMGSSGSHGNRNRLCPVIGAELGQNASDVAFDTLLADGKLIDDGANRSAAGEAKFQGERA